MNSLKLIVSGIISYIVTYFLFLTNFITPQQDTVPFFGYEVLIFLFTLFSFISISINLYNYFNKNNEQRPVPENIWLLALLVPICVIITLAVNINALEKRRAEKGYAIEKAQNYNDSMRKIVLNTTLSVPTFYITQNESSPELLIKIPVSFQPEALSTTIKTLKSNQMNFYYWASFYPISGSSSRDAESTAVVGDCKILNQFIKFEDPRIKPVNELELTQQNPAYYMSIYFWGKNCNTETLKGLVGKTLYIYSYIDTNPDSKKQMTNDYKITELN